MIRASRVRAFRVTADGVPLWSEHEQQADCVKRSPGVPRIAFYGSSITYGVGLRREEALPHQLEGHLARSLPGGACADDFSEPGFGQEQQYALARETLPKANPSLVVWEIWDANKHYTVVGDVAFDARDRTLDRAGVPVLSFVPAAVADPLFSRSHAYQYAALALARVDQGGRDSHAPRECTEILPPLKRLVADHGGRLLALKAARLDRPFDEVVQWDDDRPVVDCARNMGIQVVSIAELLRDQRVEDVRLDPCCHLNARGHALLAERLEAQVLRTLAPDAP